MALQQNTGMMKLLKLDPVIQTSPVTQHQLIVYMCFHFFIQYFLLWQVQDTSSLMATFRWHVFVLAKHQC